MKKHSFVDKHPVLASIFLTLLAIVLIPLVTEMVSALLNIGMYYWLLSLAVLVIVSLIVLLLYKLWFRPEFSGMIPGNLKEGCILLLPAVPYWLISLGYSYVFEKETLAPHMSGVIIRTALTAGILEELCFRGLMVTTLLRQWRKKDKYLQAAIVSGVVFGLIHATNAIVGADLVRTGMQVLDAGFIGVFFAAVYIRCGSLLPLMAVHALQDIIAIGLVADVSDSGVITGGFTAGVLIDAALTFGLFIIGIYLLRKDKHEEIRQLWDEKWKNQ